LNNIENIVCTKNPTKVVKICVILLSCCSWNMEQTSRTN